MADPSMSFDPRVKITASRIDATVHRPELLLLIESMSVAKVEAAMPGIVAHSSGEDVWQGADLPEENATEGGKAPKPTAPKDLGVDPVEMEQKAEDLRPKDPPVENAWQGETPRDDEPEGSTAPPDRKRAAMPGVVSRPSGEDVWEGAHP